MLPAVAFEFKRSRSVALAAVLIVAAGAVAVVLVVDDYGGASFFPGLIASFIATLFAFVLALWWERKREQRVLTNEAAEMDERRVTEVRRRFAPVRAELENDAESLETLAEAFAMEDNARVVRLLHPQLLEGAWIANAPRLSELVADYDLIGDLATTYGRIEELRWRLRHRSESIDVVALDQMTAPLVEELRAEVASLRKRVGSQIEHPTVQAVGLVHNVTLNASIRATSSMVARAGGLARSTSAEGSSDDNNEKAGARDPNATR
jgi:hypothetical protein